MGDDSKPAGRRPCGDGVGFEPAARVFVDRKPGRHEFAHRTAMPTEAEVFAGYGG